MKKPTTINLARNERILAVVPEFCSGPGWSNRLLTVHIGDYSNNTFRAEYLQFDGLTPQMMALFSIGANVCSELQAWLPTKVEK